MTPSDIVALFVFALCWLGYEPLLKLLSKKSGLIAKDLSVVRAVWMHRLCLREVRLYDANLLGHSINSASFFASASLIIIAAVAGMLFQGEIPTKIITDINTPLSQAHLLDIKLVLILLCLGRGFLDFIWALRQMNYCAAAFGSLPETIKPQKAKEFSEALSCILEPAMSNFSQGVRGYYFALAAALWLFGPVALGFGSIGATALLAWRQSMSGAASGLHKLRNLLDAEDKSIS
jgi:uncharacterized membrane protein